MNYGYIQLEAVLAAKAISLIGGWSGPGFFFSEVSHPDEPRVTQMEILLCGSTGIYNDLDNSSICTILVCWKWTRKPN